MRSCTKLIVFRDVSLDSVIYGSTKTVFRAGMGVEARRAVAGAGKGKKSSPPIFSHEFVIQNHGDISSVLLMVVFVGFMFPVSSEPPFESLVTVVFSL